MCLILCAYRSHPRFDLVVAANRDEFLTRPTEPAGWWRDRSGLLAGRDLEQLGTWLGVTTSGRFAAITNVRDRIPPKNNPPSRGELVAGFLSGENDLDDFLVRLRETGARYNGFNLLFGDRDELAYCSNRGVEVGHLRPGIYGISNALLDTPWPKVRKGKERFAELLKRSDGALPTEELFELLGDRTIAPDGELPDTGLPIELERMASSIFAAGEEYGTRSSTVVAIDKTGWVTFEERNLLSGSARRFRFEIEPQD